MQNFIIEVFNKINEGISNLPLPFVIAFLTLLLVLVLVIVIAVTLAKKLKQERQRNSILRSSLQRRMAKANRQ